MSLGHWETFYRGGALVSCPTNPEPNYSQEVRQAWVELFGRLPDGARVLDLGTGNGAVAVIARETAVERGMRFEIHGVDLAEIEPRRFVPDADTLFEGIQFHPGVSTEALPFDDASFAAISGQYIIEYTAIARSLAEAYRVLEPGCDCQFILHHSESRVVQNAVESLRQAEFVTRETRTLRKFREFCEREADRPARAGRARSQLVAVGRQLRAAADASSNPLLLHYVLQSIDALLANRTMLSRGQMLRQTQALERELHNWVLRLNDLVSAALTGDGFDAFLGKARAAGFDVTASGTQMQDGDNLVGWRAHLSRPM